MYQDRKENGPAYLTQSAASTHLFAFCPSTPELNTMEGPMLAQQGTHEPVLGATAMETVH